MKKKLKRLPTILGLLLLLGAIAGGVVLIKKGPDFFLKASPALTPTQLKVTNINDTSFTVSWTTEEQTSGFIKYGTESNLSFTAQDDRDQLSGKTGNFYVHHVTLKNLKPVTVYFFKVGSGGKLFDSNDQPYQITTTKQLATPPPNDVAYGTIVDQSGNPAEGVVVYLSLANASPVSTLTKSSGSWVIPLNLMRSADLNDWASYDKEASIEEILVQAGPLGTATVVATTRNDSPMPKITLGQSFDFRKVAEVIPEQEKIQMGNQATESSRFSLQPPPTSSPTASATPTGELRILNPDEGEAINTQQPEILGTGPIGQTLDITVESPATYSGKIRVDNQGNWQWTPPAGLEPGEHTVTVSYTDQNGLLQKISRLFVVLAAGESGLPAMTATPSGATPTPTATLAPTPTLTATASPTPSVASPSPTPTSTTSGRTSMPSTEGGVPSSGHLTPTFLVFIIGFSLIFLGLIIKKIFRF